MAMQLRQKEVPLDAKGNRKIIVAEAGWDYSFRFSETEKTLSVFLEDPNHSETFKFFLRNYYSLMASCVVEDPPTPEEAFGLERLYLDNWYWTLWELNEDIMGTPCPKEMAHEEVKFRDGTEIHVWQSHGVPSFLLKLVELESHAYSHPLENDPQGQMFCSAFYPKMAAACNGSGNVPDALTVRSWPRSEINKWLEATRRLNPDWFTIPQEVKEEEDKQKKKKGKKS